MANATSQLFFRTAIVLLIVGMGFGMFMAGSHDYAAAPAHAHLNLIGFVVMSVYGGYFALNPDKAAGPLPKIIWALNTVAIVIMFPALVSLLYGNAAIEPMVAGSAALALLAAVLFAVVLFRPVRS